LGAFVGGGRLDFLGGGRMGSRGGDGAWRELSAMDWLVVEFVGLWVVGI
jgi:hypothetical protein